MSLVARSYGATYPNDRRGQVLGRARAKLGSSIGMTLWGDFDYGGQYEAALGAQPGVGSSGGGFVVVTNAGNHAAVAVAHPQAYGGALVLLDHPNTDVWYCEAYGSCDSNPIATGQMEFCLRGSGGGLPIVRMGVEGGGAGGVTNFSAQIFDGAGIVYDHDTGVAIDKLKHRWAWWAADLNKDGVADTVLFSIDGNPVGSFLTATMSALPMQPEILTFDSANATDQIMSADYFFVCVPQKGIVP